jgi:hypothetical protein
MESLLLGRSTAAMALHNTCGEGHQLSLSQVELHLPAFNAVGVEKVLDHLSHPAGGLVNAATVLPQVGGPARKILRFVVTELGRVFQDHLGVAFNGGKRIAEVVGAMPINSFFSSFISRRRARACFSSKWVRTRASNSGALNGFVI